MEKTKKIPSKSVKSCKKKTIIIISVSAFAILATLLALAIALGWFNNPGDLDGVTKRDYVETNKKDFWEASYSYVDGRMEKTFRADGDERTLTLQFETVNGEMDLMVYDKETGYAFVGDVPTYYQCVGNGEYTITFSEDVVVRLDAREHEGRFHIEAK